MGTVLDKINDGVGFDNYYCMSEDKINSWHARASYGDICLELKSNQPGFQFYNNYYIDTDGGKDGCEYRKHCSFAFEAHGYPDAVNHPEFPSIILRPGEQYSNQIKFKLYSKNE